MIEQINNRKHFEIHAIDRESKLRHVEAILTTRPLPPVFPARLIGVTKALFIRLCYTLYIFTTITLYNHTSTVTFFPLIDNGVNFETS